MVEVATWTHMGNTHLEVIMVAAMAEATATVDLTLMAVTIMDHTQETMGEDHSTTEIVMNTMEDMTKTHIVVSTNGTVQVHY